MSTHSQILTQNLPLGKGFSYAESAHSTTPTQYVALALRAAMHFSGHISILYICIYPRTRESQISTVLVSVGLASLAQLCNLNPKNEKENFEFFSDKGRVPLQA